MNRKILFTPVGGTDPIPETNIRDGSMLHICRVYKPDHVVMYMSKEILDKQEKDSRYTACLDKLAEHIGKEISYEIIERRELTEVQDFNFFYEDFKNIIKSIFEVMDESDELLLNVSSGTPAMKSGILVLHTLGEYPGRLIQVTTPGKKMNEHIHREFDLDTFWDLNDDNNPDFENRCSEVKCPTLSKIKNEEIIKKHIDAFDYSAAINVCNTMPGKDTESYIKLLEMASARVLLDFKQVDKLLKDCYGYKMPVQDGGKRKYIEYALVLNVKLCRNEYPDFIRAITPLLVDLFELSFNKKCGIDIDQYCFVDRFGVRKWDEAKLEGTDIVNALNREYTSFRYGAVYSDHLRILINALSTDENYKQLINDLRLVEEKIRNLAAHQIVSITDAKIKELTGFHSKQIMDKIKKLFDYTDIKPAKAVWDSYLDMNAMIISYIGK